MEGEKVYDDLKRIFFAAVGRVDPYKIIKKCIKITNNTLNIDLDLEEERFSFDLDNFEKLFIIGTGKATAKMAKAVEELFIHRISKGIISVKYGHTEHLATIDTIEAGHPVPDENSIKASQKIIEIAQLADEKALVINLISGGGSSLLTKPLDYTIGSEKSSLTLKEIQKTTKALLSCGATISEINCIRKHISSIKGGRLARLLYPATQINLILSDVVGDRLDTIASGLTTFDESTYENALEIIERYDIEDKIPLKVLNLIKAGARGLIDETPKRDDRIFRKVFNILIGSNYSALLAALKSAETLGYNTIIISSQITGESKEIAKVFLGIANDIKNHDLPVKRPACIIAGGETTVTLKGCGKGGRNQELALSFLSGIQNDREDMKDTYFLSAATDGNDGPTDAAGAFASLQILETSVNMNVEDYLKNNDSYNFFDQIGWLFKTGPTNTNVCDIQILLVL